MTALALASLYLAGRVHATGGTRYDIADGRRGYGPTLANQATLDLVEAVGHINRLRLDGRARAVGETPEGATLWGA